MLDESAVLFHEYLAVLLQAQKQESGREKRTKKGLADSLGIHASFVSRWLQGIESLPHIDQLPGIIRYLEPTAFQAQRLRDAHARSLLLSRVQDPTKLSLDDQQNLSAAVERLIETASTKVKPKTPFIDMGDVDFLGKETVFYEAKILEKLIAVLQAILHDPPQIPVKQPGTIYMTRQGNDYGKHDYPDLWDKWQEAFIQLLKKGWTVEHLFRLSTDPRQSLELVENTIQYLKYGDYRPYAFTTYDLVIVPTELFIIPGHIGLLQLSTDDRGHANGGILTPDSAQVGLFTLYFEMLKSQAIPLIATYDMSNEGRQRYFAIVEKAEATTKGERYLQKSGLSYLTQPLMWFNPGSTWRQAINLPGNEIERIAEHHRACRASFDKKMKEGLHYRDTCGVAGIRQQAKDGVYHPYYDLRTEIKLPPSARIEHLRHAIWMLETYPNFEIHLFDEQEVKPMLRDSFWEIVGSRYVIMGLRNFERKYLTISIDEPLIAVGFLHYFSNLPNIDVGSGNKARTIATLEQIIAEVEALPSG